MSNNKCKEPTQVIDKESTGFFLHKGSILYIVWNAVNLEAFQGQLTYDLDHVKPGYLEYPSGFHAQQDSSFWLSAYDY